MGSPSCSPQGWHEQQFPSVHLPLRPSSPPWGPSVQAPVKQRREEGADDCRHSSCECGAQGLSRLLDSTLLIAVILMRSPVPSTGEPLSCGSLPGQWIPSYTSCSPHLGTCPPLQAGLLGWLCYTSQYPGSLGEQGPCLSLVTSPEQRLAQSRCLINSCWTDSS